MGSLRYTIPDELTWGQRAVLATERERNAAERRTRSDAAQECYDARHVRRWYIRTSWVRDGWDGHTVCYAVDAETGHGIGHGDTDEASLIATMQRRCPLAVRTDPHDGRFAS